MGRKALPLGYADFKELINQNLYYVDKTGLIKEILDTQAKIMLFTRPRRFGKTLNQSMLKYFFEKTEEDNEALFDGLEISGYDGKYMKEQGQYPVISVTFKDIKQRTYEKSYKEFMMIISEEYKRHVYLLDSPELLAEDKEIFRSVMSKEADEEDFANGIAFLAKCLNIVHGKKVVVLIDEYDVPLENAHFCGFYKDMVDLIRACFSKALKDNTNVLYGILTGCLRVSKESIFTGFNNFTVYGVTDAQFSKCFGFTNDEVTEMLRYYDVLEYANEVKEWYDGYLFGEQEIYNPFSLTNFVSKKIVSSIHTSNLFWTNTSSNSIVRDLILKCKDSTREELEKLMHGGSITKPIYEDLTYNDIERGDDSEQIWSHLLYTGYLKQRYNPEMGMYDLTIPNHEVMTTYTKIVQDVFKKKVDSSPRDALFQAILDRDEDTINLIINDWLYDSISYHDEKESFYHGTILGMLSGFKGYRLESNREAGIGRFDLMLYDARRRSVGICFEFKIADKPEQIDSKIEEALKQIQENDYTQFFRVREISNVIRYGAAFCDKRCKLKSSIIK